MVTKFSTKPPVKTVPHEPKPVHIFSELLLVLVFFKIGAVLLSAFLILFISFI